MGSPGIEYVEYKYDRMKEQIDEPTFNEQKLVLKWFILLWILAY